MPLAALGVLAIAFWPLARRRIGWIVVAIAVVGGRQRPGRQGVGPGAARHAPRARSWWWTTSNMADGATVAGGLVFLGAAGVMGLDELRRRKVIGEGGSAYDDERMVQRAVIAMGVVAVLFSLFGAYRIVAIGHSGAKAVWDPATGTNVVGQQNPTVSDPPAVGHPQRLSAAGRVSDQRPGVAAPARVGGELARRAAAPGPG